MYGVCAAATNEQRQITGIKLWVPSASYVQVEEAAPKDLFGVPACPLASLGRFGSLKSLYRWIKVSGVVLHQVPGRYVYIHDEGESLQVLSRDTPPLIPGDRIEAVGFLGRKGGRVVLREATCRKTGRAAEPGDDEPAPARRGAEGPHGGGEAQGGRGLHRHHPPRGV